LIHGEQVWFFKLTGAATTVIAEEPRFLKFLETVTLTGP